MTTQKDILRAMMTQLDDASDKIPEGLYLQFCDHLKNLHTCQPASSGRRRCSRCHQVGHNRRGCRYHEADHHALDSAYQNGQTPAEAGIEKNPVVVIYYSDGGVTWSPANGGNIVITVYMPEAEFSVGMPNRDTCTYTNLGSELHIQVPGKYKADIRLPAKMHDIGKTNWNPQTHCLTVTLPIAGVKK
tara:strand:- start:1217 stop:1780 length:564 start_codon:yes stop_codon:yes gene_type:complete